MTAMASARWLVVMSLLACARAPAPPPEIAIAAPTPTPAPAPSDAEPVQTEPSPAIAVPVTYPRPPEWPAALLFPPTFDPSRASATVGEHGDLRLEHSVADATITLVVATWRTALADGGFTPREPCDDGPSIACVFTGNDRLLTLAATAVLDRNTIEVTVQWLPPGHVAPKRMPGPCITPPFVRRSLTVTSSGIDQEGEFRQGSTRWEIATHPGADLDGDGQADVLVPHAKGGDCPWEIPHDVFVMRGACGHRVGTIVAPVDPRTHTAGFHRGVREVFTQSSWADHGSDSPIPEHHTRERRYVFDGRTLKRRSDTTRSGRCHHCGVAQCRED